MGVYHIDDDIVDGIGLSKFILKLGDFGMDDRKTEKREMVGGKKKNDTTDICSQKAEESASFIN